MHQSVNQSRNVQTNEQANNPVDQGKLYTAVSIKVVPQQHKSARDNAGIMGGNSLARLG